MMFFAHLVKGQLKIAQGERCAEFCIRVDRSQFDKMLQNTCSGKMLRTPSILQLERELFDLLSRLMKLKRLIVLFED